MRVDGVWLRRSAYLGARFGPRAFLEYAPSIIGKGFSAVLPSVRRRVIENLRLVYGPRPAPLERQDARATFANFASCLAETLALQRKEARRARLEVLAAQNAGLAVEQLRNRLASKRGLVVVTAHVGPFEAAASCLAKDFDKDVVLVMAPEPDPEARRYHDQLRERHGVRVVHVGDHHTDALAVLSHLRAGGVAALQLDRLPPGARVIRERLFGSPTLVPQGPFRLAGLAKVPIVSVFASRRGMFDYDLTVGAPLELGKKPSEAELREAARQTLGEMESAILRDPTQWFHFEPAVSVRVG